MKEKNECMKKGFERRINTFFEIVKTKKEDGIRNDVEADFPTFSSFKQAGPAEIRTKSTFWMEINS